MRIQTIDGGRIYNFCNHTGVVTNSINAIVVALATASIGGIFSSTATDMGVQVGIFLFYSALQTSTYFSI